MNTPSKNRPVVLITGALTGTGRATALAFAHQGARLGVSGRHDDEGQKLVAELRKLGTEAEFLRSDVRHDDTICAAWSIRPSRALVVWTWPSTCGSARQLQSHGPTSGIASHPDPLSATKQTSKPFRVIAPQTLLAAGNPGEIATKDGR